MPHQHDERTGEFQPSHDGLIQVESGCKVSFQQSEQIARRADRYLPVAWRWQAGASRPASVCEMVLGPDVADLSVKHKMVNED